MPTVPPNSTCIRSRSDTTANWTAANPILLQGEWAHDVTTGCVRIGDGVKHWADLCDFCPECDSPPPPPPPTGACCFGATCVGGMTQAACVAAGGTWKGAGTSCSPNPCQEIPPTRPRGSGSGSGSGLGGCDGYCWTDYYCESDDGSLRLFDSSGAGYISYSQCVQAWNAARTTCVPMDNISNPPCDYKCDIRMRYDVPAGCDRCGLSATFTGERGLHEFLIDLKDKSGVLGVWFNSETQPDRFSLHWPLNNNNQALAALPEYTSGWRGDKAMEPAIASLSGSSPYLKYPKSHGPVLYNGSFNNGPKAMITEEVLGPLRTNEGWGYFLFVRTAEQAASGAGRYARLVVEAPLEATKWYCGLICDVPGTMPVCWGGAGPVSKCPPPGNVDAGPYYDSACAIGKLGPSVATPGGGVTSGPVLTPDDVMYITSTGPSKCPGEGGTRWELGAHDWRARTETGLRDDYIYGSIHSSLPSDVIESLYHPRTGFWVSSKIRICTLPTNPHSGPADTTGGCTTAGWYEGAIVAPIDPGGTTYGMITAAGGEFTGGQEPPRGPGGVG